MAAPKLTVTTLTASGFGHVRLYQQKYTGADNVEYGIFAAYKTGATTDSIYVFKKDLSTDAGYTFTEVKSGLTKYLDYNFCLYQDRIYYTNGTDDIGWIYCDDSGTFSSGTMDNAPLAEIIISAKNCLWAGGATYLEYSTGTAVFTQSSKTVTGTGTSWKDNVRQGDLIGTGASPSTFYIVDRVDSDTSLQLTIAFAESTTSNTSYLAKKESRRNIFYSAEGAMNTWDTPGENFDLGGFDAGVMQIDQPNTGLHNFDDAVLIFSKDKGFYITGINPDDWQIPQNTKLPVGCISHRSIVSKDGLLGFLSEKGFYISKGGGLSFSDLGAAPFSELVTPQFTDIDKESADKAHSFVYKDSLFISVPATSEYSETDSQLSYSTGTVSITDGTTTVTGSASVNWRGLIHPGDQIRFDDETDVNGDPLYYTISAIATGEDGNITIDRNKDDTVSSVSYVIRKRRCNKILVLDTRTNVRKNLSIGWTVFDGVNTDGFLLFDNKLFYGSSTEGNVYQYDTGGQLYGSSFTASAKLGRWDCGYPNRRKYFKQLLVKAKGTGTLYVTPYYDGTAGTEVQYTFSDSSQFEHVYFPRASGSTEYPFNGIANEIELKLELRASSEDLEIAVPHVFFELLPIS